MRMPFKIVLEKTRRQFLLGSASLGALIGISLNGVALGAEGAAPVLDARAKESLSTLAQRMFPHKDFNETVYKGVADAVAADVSRSMQLNGLIAEGIKSLDAEQESDWLSASEKAQIAAMKAIQEQPFFQYVLHKSIDVLYRDPSLLGVLGYEGSSIEKGGYLHRGFNDIDWLP